MKRVYFFFFLVFVMLKGYSQCADSANIFSFVYANKNYEIVKEMKNWVNASACAVERGGYLVEINDLSEQTAMISAIVSGAQIPSDYTSISNGGGIAYIWIGATDQNSEGTWIWDGNNDNSGINFWTGQGANGANNGTAVDSNYYNWGGKSAGTPQEPDDYNSNQDHAAIGLAGWPSGTTMLGSPGEWNDIIGSSQLYFIIEYDDNSKSNDIKTNSLKIYPNPANDKITISSVNKIYSVEIFNLNGSKVYSESKINKNDFLLNTKKYKSGLYIVKVFDGETYYYEKLIIE